MHANTVNTSTKALFTGALLLGILDVLLSGTAVWASTRFGQDIEVQAWYRTRTTFQTDGKEHFGLGAVAQ